MLKEHEVVAAFNGIEIAFAVPDAKTRHVVGLYHQRSGLFLAGVSRADSFFFLDPFGSNVPGGVGVMMHLLNHHWPFAGHPLWFVPQQHRWYAALKDSGAMVLKTKINSETWARSKSLIGWLPGASSETDWRPDHSVPEDYYA